MRVYLWTLGTYGSIDIPKAIALLLQQLHGFSKQYFRIDAISFFCCVGEMEPNISHVCRSEKCIADGMYEHVSIAMSEESECMLNFYSS